MGSRLAGLEQAASWSAGLGAAVAWTFRRPQCTEGEAVAALKQLAGRAPWLAVHGRGDWAAATGAAAVIAGRGSLAPASLRSLFPGLLLGCSVHDPLEQAQATDAGADFLIFGPVWETPSKAGVLAPRGVGGLETSVAGGLPVIAIGGITTAEQVRACREAGARGAAVLRAARQPDRLADLAAAWSAV